MLLPCRSCLRSACSCLRSAAFPPLSSFKTAPAALAPGSLICRATPRLPPLPQPRRGRGGVGHTPPGTPQHPRGVGGGRTPLLSRPEHPGGGSAGDGAAAPVPAQLGRFSPGGGLLESRDVCACVWNYEWGCKVEKNPSFASAPRSAEIPTHLGIRRSLTFRGVSPIDFNIIF